MIDIEPIFFTEKKAYAMGQTNLNGQTKRLLKTGYNTLFICQTGWAVISLYNKNYLFRAGEVFNANWDMRPVVLRVSDDFSTYYCLMSESFFYDVFRNVNGSFCDFTFTYPIFKPSIEQSEQLELWLKQIMWLYKHSECSNIDVLIKNYINSLFLIIDSEIQKNIPHTNLRHMPRSLEILRQFGSLLEKYANTEHGVAFYAEKLFITPYYLSTITSEIMHDSPKGLIDKQVIFEMMSILKNTDMPLKQIADKMNFEDTSYMSRYFRRHTGMSPSDYRK
ncbi:helix-turn-helix domain-containing protein [Prevotella sp.]|uniref:helix-turn-helix domain-containing protein n=1 Tax=Prevotella sp. TaxID=59823 RepID=UPI003DA3DC9E